MANVNEVEWLHRAERKEFISFLVFQDNEDILGIPFGSLKPPPPPSPPSSSSAFSPSELQIIIHRFHVGLSKLKISDTQTQERKKKKPGVGRTAGRQHSISSKVPRDRSPERAVACACAVDCTRVSVSCAYEY